MKVDFFAVVNLINIGKDYDGDYIEGGFTVFGVKSISLILIGNR